MRLRPLFVLPGVLVLFVLAQTLTPARGQQGKDASALMNGL